MKRTRRKRIAKSLAIIGASGIVMASGELSCGSFAASNVLTSFDLCFLFNCNEGAIGGLIDFCSPFGFQSFVGGPQDPTADPILADCPDSP